MSQTARAPHSDCVRANGYKSPAHKGTNMPIRGELSVAHLERHSVRSDNKEFLLITTFCILGLTVSIFIAVVCQASEPANIMLAVQALG
jgi:hypothetical protein